MTDGDPQPGAPAPPLPDTTEPKDIFRRFIWRLRELVGFVDVSAHGYQIASMAVFLEEKLVRTEPASAAEVGDALVYAQRLEEHATAEGEVGTPYLYGLASAQLWAFLEAHVEDVAVAWLENRATWQEDAVKRVAGPLAEFAASDDETRARLLYEQLRVPARGGERDGIGKYEGLLERIGLGGGVDGAVRDALFELSQVRHVVAHKGGFADAEFVTRRPQFGAVVGKRMPVTRSRFFAYFHAVRWYHLEIHRRWFTRRWEGEPTKQAEFVAMMGELLKRESAHMEGALRDTPSDAVPSRSPAPTGRP